jgi:hypothetical protein
MITNAIGRPIPNAPPIMTAKASKPTPACNSPNLLMVQCRFCMARLSVVMALPMQRLWNWVNSPGLRPPKQVALSATVQVEWL